MGLEGFSKFGYNHVPWQTENCEKNSTHLKKYLPKWVKKNWTCTEIFVKKKYESVRVRLLKTTGPSFVFKFFRIPSTSYKTNQKARQSYEHWLLWIVFYLLIASDTVFSKNNLRYFLLLQKMWNLKHSMKEHCWFNKRK